MALAAVGGVLLTALLQVTFERLASKSVIDYFRRKKLDLNLLNKLTITMLSINKLIDDAEQKETTNRSVKQWLDALKEAVYDAEDVLDVISTLDHTHKMKTKFHRFTSKLRSSWNPFDVPIDQELDNVFAKLQFLLEQKDVLGLKESNPASSRLETPMRLPTTSLVEESAVYGRDVDKECIKKLLLSNDGSNGDVIAIVGMGGLGKTTLSQLVFNNDEINGIFKPNKVWICVAEDFDVIKITKTILEKLTSQSFHTNDFDHLQMKLKETLSGKRFLIALDDVWNENYTNWDNLRKPFGSAATGSKIIVTTRSEKVASVMRATSTYKLKPLSDEACWLLFAKHAFENVQSNAYSTFEALGKELVKKCRGLPLAAKVLAGVLRTRLGYEEWDEILKSDLWDLSDEVSDNILPVLRLSYHYLPSNLKRCFAFCSIFPKDYNFEKNKLVLLWMGENLLPDSKGKKRYDVGHEYLHDLESRSLIKSSSYRHFEMHDLVNDLAKSVAGEFGTCYDVGTPFKFGEKARYFSYLMSIDDNDLARVKGINEAKRLRTLLLFPQEWKMDMTLHSEITYDVLSRLKLLRTLALLGYYRQLPNSIGNLKLLRYLDLSSNSELRELPESVASLYNLEILILQNCMSLSKLPESLASLYNLEVLNLSGCSSLTKLPSKMRQLIKLKYLNIRDSGLQEMPLQMGRLKDLDVLTDFVLGKGSGSSIGELKGSKDLRGELRIHGLQNITHPEDALVANLKGKSNLEELWLEWNIDHDNSEDATIILDNLQPHVNLKKLSIWKYSGTRLPDWSGQYSFANLASIELWKFEHCFDLSPLGQLPSLKSLYIYWCVSVVILVGTKIPVELPNEIHHHVGHFFSALVELTILGCPKLELPQHHCFPSIEDFTLWSSCDSLQSFALSSFPKLRRLSLTECRNLESLSMLDGTNHINLEFLFNISISRCPKFEHFNVGESCAPKMTGLDLVYCEGLKVLPENMCTLFPSLSGLVLEECPNLEVLPQSGLPRSLSTLIIKKCNKLTANHLSWGLHTLLSLSHLEISFDSAGVESFPEEGLLPSSLTYLSISNAANLTSLNGISFQVLTSLDRLELHNCTKLQCLPKQGLPTSLSSLGVRNCPLLEARCQREQGEDWLKIAHLANVFIAWLVFFLY